MPRLWWEYGAHCHGRRTPDHHRTAIHLWSLTVFATAIPYLEVSPSPGAGATYVAHHLVDHPDSRRGRVHTGHHGQPGNPNLACRDVEAQTAAGRYEALADGRS
jgi:hypothetical protein